MAHSYSHLYKIPTTGLRFFTVYGPWDRPDMALQKFTHQIIKGQNIKIFNHGNHKRDFTYIDDIVEGVIRVLDKVATSNPDWNSDFPDSSTSNAPWRIYNIGNTQPIKLMNYIEAIEKALKKKANKQLLPIQQGDVPNTWANVEELKREFNYQPNTTIEEGINKFVEWFRDYYKI
jgi:UDP-glucuronate 4-epimerase